MSNRKYPDFEHYIRVASERQYDGVCGEPPGVPERVARRFRKTRDGLIKWVYAVGYSDQERFRASDMPCLDAASEVFDACERSIEQGVPFPAQPLNINPAVFIGSLPIRTPKEARVLVRIKRLVEHGEKAGLIVEIIGASADSLVQSIRAIGPHTSKDNPDMADLIHKVFKQISNLFQRPATKKEVWDGMKEELGTGLGSGYFHTVVFETKTGKERMKWWASDDMNEKSHRFSKDSLNPYLKKERENWEQWSFLED